MAAILGYGAVSSLGYGAQRMWSAMAEGFDGIAPVRRFDTSAFGAALGAIVPDRNAPEFGGSRLCIEMATAAAREAWQRAGLDGTPRDRIALVLGTSLGTVSTIETCSFQELKPSGSVLVHEITAAVGDALGVAGPRLTVSTACASSTNAIGLALDLLAMDAADIVIAGGADVLTPLVYAGFAALGVLSCEKCAPFSEPPGTTLGEGAGFVVLGRDRKRADALAIVGYGLSTDAFHETSPDPTGAGVARSMRGALAHAGISADAVDYVNVHGTGTRANDPAEWRALQLVLGERAATVPASASKSFLGHAQGAAGVLETVATLIAMERGALPPTQRVTARRPNTPPDVVAGGVARRADCNVVLKQSAGFGGANASIVIARGRTSPSVARRPVFVAAHVSVGAESELPPSIDPRGLDVSTRMVTAAVARALAAAGIRLRGEARDRAGLIVGLIAADRECDRLLQDMIARDGYRALSANLFARQVLNAAPGTCARLLGIRGLHSVISAGSASGVAAAVYAAELLASRRDVDVLIAAHLEEARASCAVLLATPTDVRIERWHVAGAQRAHEGDPRPEVGSRWCTRLDRLASGPAAETTDAVTDGLGQATELIRSGQVRTVLVKQSASGCADVALVLTGGHHEP